MNDTVTVCLAPDTTFTAKIPKDYNQPVTCEVESEDGLLVFTCKSSILLPSLRIMTAFLSECVHS